MTGMSKLVVFVLGPDRPGIIATVAQTLFEREFVQRANLALRHLQRRQLHWPGVSIAIHQLLDVV
jgi:glycine cleavage system regulatory protein